MNKQKKYIIKLINIFLQILIILQVFCYGFLFAQSNIFNTNIPFSGNANGGKLVLGYIQDPHSVHISNVSIDTFSGETAESIVKRLATEIVNSDNIFTSSRQNTNANMMVIQLAQGNNLSLPGLLNNYLLAGSETGLGIPKSPLSLCCSYDEVKQTISVMWTNPNSGLMYDSLYIRWRYRNRPEDTPDSGGGKFIVGTPTKYIIKIPSEVNDLDTDIWIKGFRHVLSIEEMRAKGIPLNKEAIPSNVTAIHMTSDSYSQDESYGIPFSNGVAPNWLTWSTAPKINISDFEQGEKYAGVRRYQPTKSLSTKPYYQIIKAPFRGVAHGVYRKFIGLTPGHTYRLMACLSSLEMDSIEENWSYSLHFTTNPPDGKNLTTEQMTGMAPLPNGEKGHSAGQVCYFDPNNTTKGKFDYAITGYSKRVDGSISSNITLPNNVNEITVWVKFICDDNSGKVGFSGVKLEDITAIKNLKEPQQIIMEEQESEIELLKWIQERQKIISNERVRNFVPSKLTVKNTSFDFGEIKPNSTRKAVFDLTNNSNGPIAIEDVKTCCGAVTTLDKKELAPGESCSVQVKYQFSTEIGIFRKSIAIITNEPNSLPIVLKTTGTMIQTLKWTPERFKIFSFEKDLECPEIKISSLDGTPLSVKKFDSSSNSLYVDFDPNFAAMDIILKPKIIADKLKNLTSNNGFILIELNHPDYKQIKLSFDVVQALQTIPTQILIFNEKFNYTIDRSIEIQDNQNPLNIDILEQIESIVSENGTKVEILKSAMVNKKCKLDLRISPPDNNIESISKDNIVIRMKDGRQVSVPVITTSSMHSSNN